MTGAKSFILKAFDPFFRKNGQTELPIKITGTREHPSFGLTFVTKIKTKGNKRRIHVRAAEKRTSNPH